MLFRDALGISVRTVRIDTLHTLYLGPVRDWISRVLWDVARENAYKVAGVGVTQTLPETCFRLRNGLQNFYKTYKRANPREDITEMVDITPSMFGTSRSEKFGPVKAAEMKHMVPFCLSLLAKFATNLGDAHSAKLTHIGESFQVLIAVMRDNKINVPNLERQKMFDAVARLCHYWDSVGINAKPKRHLLLHLVERTAYQGNPAYYACWMDETLNKTLAAVGQAAHRMVWELRVLREMETVRERAAKKQRW